MELIYVPTSEQKRRAAALGISDAELQEQLALEDVGDIPVGGVDRFLDKIEDPEVWAIREERERPEREKREAEDSFRRQELHARSLEKKPSKRKTAEKKVNPPRPPTSYCRHLDYQNRSWSEKGSLPLNWDCRKGDDSWEREMRLRIKTAKAKKPKNAKRAYGRIGQDVGHHVVTPAQQLQAIKWVVTGEKTQREVAQLYKITHQTISLWCSGYHQPKRGRPRKPTNLTPVK